LSGPRRGGRGRRLFALARNRLRGGFREVSFDRDEQRIRVIRGGALPAGPVARAQLDRLGPDPGRVAGPVGATRSRRGSVVLPLGSGKPRRRLPIDPRRFGKWPATELGQPGGDQRKVLAPLGLGHRRQNLIPEGEEGAAQLEPTVWTGQ